MAPAARSLRSLAAERRASRIIGTNARSESKAEEEKIRGHCFMQSRRGRSFRSSTRRHEVSKTTRSLELVRSCRAGRAAGTAERGGLGRRASSFESPHSSSCRLRELRDFVLNRDLRRFLTSSLPSSSHHVAGVGNRAFEVLGARRAARDAIPRAKGDPDNARSARSNRHFDANSRRRARASASCA